MPIRIRGAREHNLQGVDVEFGDGLTVVTGVSGSGKTSLVFDTLYHEAHRRFREVFALGDAARRLAPAQVEAIEGLCPAVSVGQNLLNRNPASTLATASGLHPFLRLLYARYGRRRCAHCDTDLAVFSGDELVERVVATSRRGPVSIVAPLVRRARGSHRTLLALLRAEFGAGAVWVDRRPAPPVDVPLDPGTPHDVDAVVARFDGVAAPHAARRAVGQVAALGAGALRLRWQAGEEVLSRAPVCPGWVRRVVRRAGARPLSHALRCLRGRRL